MGAENHSERLGSEQRGKVLNALTSCVVWVGPWVGSVARSLISLHGLLTSVVYPASANGRRVNTVQVETPSSPGASCLSPCSQNPEATGEGAQASRLLQDERPRRGQLRTQPTAGCQMGEALDGLLSTDTHLGPAKHNRSAHWSPAPSQSHITIKLISCFKLRVLGVVCYVQSKANHSSAQCTTNGMWTDEDGPTGRQASHLAVKLGHWHIARGPGGPPRSWARMRVRQVRHSPCTQNGR